MIQVKKDSLSLLAVELTCNTEEQFLISASMKLYNSKGHVIMSQPSRASGAQSFETHRRSE
jgi:hypothetical protein